MKDQMEGSPYLNSVFTFIPLDVSGWIRDGLDLEN